MYGRSPQPAHRLQRLPSMVAEFSIHLCHGWFLDLIQLHEPFAFLP